MILARSCRHTTYFAALTLLLAAPLDARSCEEPRYQERCGVMGLEAVDIPCLSITRAPLSCAMEAEYTCEDEGLIELILGGSDLHYIKRGTPATLHLIPSEGREYPLSLRWRHMTEQGITSGEERIQYSSAMAVDDEYEDYDIHGCEGDDGGDVAFSCASSPASAPHTPLYAALIALITWRHRRRQP